MKKIPAIKTVMTPFPYSIEADQTVNAAIASMQSHSIHHLPVTEDGELTGIISHREIQRRQNDGEKSGLCVSDVMTTEFYTVDLSERLDSALHRMAEHHLDTIVVTRKGKLAGIFTYVDACAAFAEFLREQVRRSGGDTAA